MYKHILVPATGLASDAAVFATALLAARPAGAHLEFLHVKPDTTDMLMAMTSGGLGGGAVVQEVIDRMDAEANAAEKKAWAAFSAFCQAEGIAATTDGGKGMSAELAVETGSESQWLAEHGRFADLIVLGRTREGHTVELEVMEAALLDTGRPLLIAPAKAPATLPGVVAIAWKDTPEAARAVTAALPFIAQAEKVVIFTVIEGAGGETSAARLARSLRWHNPRTEVQQLQADTRPPVEQLLAAAEAQHAGLLVMGGYSHSRLREVVFGGFTQRVLRDADLPVLMAH